MPQGATLLSVVLAFLGLITPPHSYADNENDLIIETDLLDDDRRAILDLLLDPKVAPRIKLIIVSTGNVHLRTAELRQMIAGLNLDTKVVAGTATNTSLNPVTAFTGGVDNEGKWLLTQKQLATLNSDRVSQTSGKANVVLAKLASDYAASGKKLDVLLLTAPKVVGPYAAGNTDTAKKAFGDAFGMGFWKKQRDGTMTAPYNFVAGSGESKAFMKAYDEGVFHNLYHVRTDVVQNNTGLPGGFVPENGPLRNSLERGMNGSEVLRRSLDAAREYGLAWTNWSIQNLGWGNTETTRWVPSTWKSPNVAAGFYYADMAPAQLTKMSKQELQGLKHTVISHQPELTARTDATGNTQFDVAFKPGGRPVVDVEELDGVRALNEHVKKLNQARNVHADPSRFNANTDFTHVDPKDVEIRPAEHLKKRALVISFKNSPDDWMGLLHLLNTSEGRNAVQHGGIIVEGFEVDKVADNVRSVLKELGVNDVHVAQGHQYDPKEIESLTNLYFEKTFYGLGEGTKAFEGLPRVLNASPISPDEVIRKSIAWAKANGGKVDAIVLGEGSDIVDSINLLPKDDVKERIGSLFLMGGGRPKDVNDLRKGYDKTRNWVRVPDKLFSTYSDLGAMGKKIFVFSSDQFGGAMLAKTTKNLGNGEVMFSELDRLGMDSRVLGAVRDHWERWSRVSPFFMSKDPNKKFDPNAPVDILTTSPLGLHIADGWISGDLEAGNFDRIKGTRENIVDYLNGGPQKDAEKANVTWLTRENKRDIARLAARFGVNLDRLVLSSLSHQFDEANRVHGPNSSEALELRQALDAFSAGMPENSRLAGCEGFRKAGQ